MNPTPIRTNISGTSIAVGTANNAKSVADAEGAKNRPMSNANIKVLNRITTRDFTLSEYLSEKMSDIEHSIITINMPSNMIVAGFMMLKKWNSLCVRKAV